MTFCNETERARVHELLPLFAGGLLADRERVLVESGLDRYPELKPELESWRKLAAAYGQLAEELPTPPPSAFSKILARIEEQESHPSFAARMFGRPIFTYALMAAQLAVILTLVFELQQRENAYRALVASAPAPEREGIRIGVVLNPESREREIRALLSSLNGKIVAGPAPSGQYVIALPASAAVESVLSTLRSSGLVLHAEKGQ